MAADAPSTAQRIVAAAIFLPIGLGAKAVEELPGAVSKARQRLVVARFIGKLAVDQGTTQLRRRLNAPASGSSAAPMTGVRRNASASASRTSARVGATSTASAEASPADLATPDAASAQDLALPDYDQLPAAHILGRLDRLTQDERDAIERYEVAHRRRRTVLGKLDQLRDAVDGDESVIGQ